MIFLGREISEQRDYSEKVAEEIDDEVRRIIDTAYHTAKQVLSDHRDKLEDVVNRILEDETLEGDDLVALLEAPVGSPPPRKTEPPAPAAPPQEEEQKPTEEPGTPTPQIKPGLAYGSQSNITLDPSD
jgi:cell division protease FtsH